METLTINIAKASSSTYSSGRIQLVIAIFLIHVSFRAPLTALNYGNRIDCTK